MKRATILIIIGALLGGGGVWLLKRGGAAVAEEKPATEEEGKPGISRDSDGNVVISMTDEMQGDIGIVVTNPAAAELSPEIKGYGRVVDPAPLGKLLLDLAAADQAFDVSHQELERMKVLRAQTNASERAFEAALAAYRRDQLAESAIRVQIQMNWGNRMMELLGPAVVPPGTERKPDRLPFELMDQASALVRVDLPGQYLSTRPESARIVPLTDDAPVEAQFFDFALAIDPQTQAQGIFFLLPQSKAHFAPGAAVTGYVRIEGAPLQGVIVPRDAVIRTEGRGWVYVLNDNGASFTRKGIPLDHPTGNGFFVANGLTANNYIVITGAQTLLSEEMKGSISAD